jgi:hypothetical protein
MPDCVKISVVSHHSLFAPVSYLNSQVSAYSKKGNIYINAGTFQAVITGNELGDYAGTVTFNNISYPATFHIVYYQNNQLAATYEAGDIFGNVLSVYIR